MGVNYTHHLSLSLFVLLYLCSLSVSAVSSFEEEHHVPLFSVADLSSGRRQLELAEILSTTGLLAISDNDNHDLQANKVKKTALEGICRCSSSQEFQQLEGTDSILLGDGQTVRSTLATATLGHSPLPLPSNLEQLCGKETADALDALRDHVAHKADAFTAALDTLLKKMSVGVSVAAGSLDTPALPLLQNYHGGSYQSIEQIVQASSNLEHFHIYSKPSVKSEKQLKSQEDPALQVHTDAGLFLAFVPAHRCRSGMDHPDSSFYFEDQDGRLKRAIFPPNSVAIMLGAGAQHWLQTPSNLSLKATRHSVRMEAGVSRAWYGMMHLVPESALVENTATQQRTFADMRQAMVLKYNTKTKRTFGDDPQNAEATGVSIGCGFADTNNVKDSDQAVGRQPQPAKTARRRLQHVENGGACNNQTNFYCWMSCLDIPEADRAQGYINEGYSLYCVDPLVLASSGNRVSKAVEPCNEAGVIGGAMNTICVGSWQPTAPGVPPQQVAVDYPEGYTVEEPFCYGGTSMYMDGFQWLGSTCPIYLFPSLVLDSAQALILACIFTIVFGISLEWFIQRRRVIAKRLEPGYGRLCVSACLYGVQLTMGYTIMLVVMIYSIPLFLSVVVGIVGGHVLFSAQDAVVPSCLSASAAEASLKEDDEDAMGVSHFCSESSSIIEGFGSGPTTANSTNNESTYQPITGQNVNGSSSPGQDDSGVAEGSTPCCQHTV